MNWRLEDCGGVTLQKDKVNKVLGTKRLSHKDSSSFSAEL